jgi:hypothetical protein
VLEGRWKPPVQAPVLRRRYRRRYR